MTPEEYIQAYTRGCSNELVYSGYHKWLTPENAIAAVELAREEMMKDAIDGEIIGHPKDIKGSFVRFPVYALKEVAHFPINGKVGDKVKLIIIKE